ncbi:hypothetical protein [Pseudoroseomonas cervicalis]|uniref:hypothetical protein n=1 Tax=Teichococcus cervicalis TaxID=204525 RepID=UPI0022F1BEA8|nr:hypothetical protein [Pseudoroseomonas cervicalis]MDQ1080142.1 hypothetical protein [Pseudoroseomonas cervicalis]WBV43964.1 hypothetical protein PFY06_05185 [Pseudoroseomonas cervicalis]
MRKTIVRLGLVAGMGLGLAACTDPYNPGQRAIGGGLLGAGAGAGVAGLTGGNAGTGALIGGALGAVGGAATTPERPYGPPPGYYRGY